jgi:hypothetical protein
LDFRAIVLFCSAWPWNFSIEKGPKESQTKDFITKCGVWGVFGGHFSVDKSRISIVEQPNAPTVEFRFQVQSPVRSLCTSPGSSRKDLLLHARPGKDDHQCSRNDRTCDCIRTLLNIGSITNLYQCV